MPKQGDTELDLDVIEKRARMGAHHGAWCAEVDMSLAAIPHLCAALRADVSPVAAQAPKSRGEHSLEPHDLTEEEAQELDRIRSAPSPLEGRTLKRVPYAQAPANGGNGMTAEDVIAFADEIEAALNSDLRCEERVREIVTEWRRSVQAAADPELAKRLDEVRPLLAAQAPADDAERQAALTAAKMAMGALRYAVPGDVWRDFENRMRPLFLAYGAGAPAVPEAPAAYLSDFVTDLQRHGTIDDGVALELLRRIGRAFHANEAADAGTER